MTTHPESRTIETANFNLFYTAAGGVFTQRFVMCDCVNDANHLFPTDSIDRTLSVKNQNGSWCKA